MNRKILFFRNDDVRHMIEKELVQLVEIFVNAKVPISLAAEPANLTDEVVGWLLDLKMSYPDIIEIIQHGYNHNKYGKYPKGTEFGTTRTFDEQYLDIKEGKRLMNDYFGSAWFPAMAFPYGSYNSDALMVLDKLNFKVLTGGVDFNLKHRIKNFIGQTTASDFVLGKKIRYHNQIRKNYNFLEVDASVNMIKKHLSADEAEHFSLNELKEHIEYNSKFTDTIGVLFHHRCHSGQFNKIAQLLEWIKDKGYIFNSFEGLYNLHASKVVR